LVQGAPVIPDHAKGTPGTHSIYMYFFPTKQLVQGASNLIIPSALYVLNLAVCGCETGNNSIF
jgi:hypothetical protein